MDRKLDVYKLHGDKICNYISKEFNINSFPTINIINEDSSIINYWVETVLLTL